MPIVDNLELYQYVKQKADDVYHKNSAFKSGWIVKMYKHLGGTYTEDNQRKKLAEWYKESWQDVGHKNYPVFRPTKRVTKDTPLLASEIDPKNLKQQIQLKQKIKGKKNLPPFLPK